MPYSGIFKPRNPQKYNGDASRIVYRSSWEARVMNYLDDNPSVIWWAPGKQGHVSGAKADELTASRSAMPTAVVFDESGVVGQAYAAKTTPHMYVIDKAGVLQYMGGIDSIASAKVDDIAKATPYFANAAKAVLTGKTPDPAVTKPYGCSIKY